MDQETVAAHWNRNAENWAPLSRQGYDVFRDHVNTPAFLELLPPVEGLRGLDLGCGEGTNTRRVAERGARVTGIDVARVFLDYARQTEREDPRGIEYLQASASELPFEDESFDFATAFMSLMDLPDQEGALREARRVLKPGGFLQFSITHPCFHTRGFGWIHDEAGERVAIRVGDYFRPWWGEVEEWTFGAAPAEAREALPNFAPFQVPRFDRTLSDWLNLLSDVGLRFERACEPSASDAALAACPKVADTRVFAYSLILRVRRPGPAGEA